MQSQRSSALIEVKIEPVDVEIELEPVDTPPDPSGGAPRVRVDVKPELGPVDAPNAIKVEPQASGDNVEIKCFESYGMCLLFVFEHIIYTITICVNKSHIR